MYLLQDKRLLQVVHGHEAGVQGLLAQDWTLQELDRKVVRWHTNVKRREGVVGNYDPARQLPRLVAVCVSQG